MTSFFTVWEMNLDDMLMGVTHWKSMQGFGEIAIKLLP